jgi:hypothetical protein
MRCFNWSALAGVTQQVTFACKRLLAQETLVRTAAKVPIDMGLQQFFLNEWCITNMATEDFA